jgi:ABC-type xylose transport system substrate-binding protein
MPTKTSTRWISDGEHVSPLKHWATQSIYSLLISIPNQLAQLENMVSKG